MSPNRAFAFAAASIVLLLGCTKEPAVAPPPVDSSTVAVPPSPPTVSASDPRPVPTPSTPSKPGTPSVPGAKGAKEGEMCGGIAGFQCAEGLTCKMTGPSHPDQAGTCAKP